MTNQLKKHLLSLAVALVWAPALLAQGSVVAPERPLDPERALVRSRVLVLRDSLVTVDGAAASLQRDFRQASAHALESRARVMRDACSRSLRSLPATREAVAKFNAEPRVKRLQSDALGSFERLQTSLALCETEFAAMSERGKGEEVRSYGNRRAEQVVASLRHYGHTMQGLLSALQINIRPLGSGKSQLAG
jgi:hypothetical protein